MPGVNRAGRCSERQGAEPEDFNENAFTHAAIGRGRHNALLMKAITHHACAFSFAAIDKI